MQMKSSGPLSLVSFPEPLDARAEIEPLVAKIRGAGNDRQPKKLGHEANLWHVIPRCE